MELRDTEIIKNLYDKSYLNGYRETLCGYEYARRNALDHFISKVLKVDDARKVLHYGSGSGLFIELWRKLFPSGELYFCGIMPISLKILINKYTLVCKYEITKNYSFNVCA